MLGFSRIRRAVLAIAAASALAICGGIAEAKTFRINVVADPAQMDPITVSEITAGRILKNMYEGFTDVDPDGKVINVLAESWEAIANGNGFRFHLRKGVKFHSGRPFTAKDVKYTLETLLAPDSKGGLSAPYLVNIVGAADVQAGKTKDLEGVKIVDENTVDITFTKPEVLFPIYPIFYMDSGIVAEQGSDWMTKVSAGTGPYKFKQWKRGVSVESLCQPGLLGRGAQDRRSVFCDRADRRHRACTIRCRRARFCRRLLGLIPPGAAGRKLQGPAHRDSARPGALPRHEPDLYAPFKDKRVREALSLAIDRQAMVKGLYGGAAFPANGFVTPGVPGYTPGLPDLVYDPDKAKALMAQADYPDGKDLPPVDLQTTEPNKAEAAYYADQFNRVLGMPVSVKIVERATFIKAMNAGEVPFFPWAWTIDYPDAASYLGDMWYSGSPYDRPRWKNADYDKLIEQARTTADETARFALYSKAEKILLDDWGAIPLPTTAVLGLRKPNVHNVTITPFGFSTFKDITID